MKQELSGFSTVEIEVRFNDGMKDSANPYLWFTQSGTFDDERETVVIPVAAWQDFADAVYRAINGGEE